MQSIYGISLLWPFLAVLCVGLVFGLRSLLTRLQVRADARSDYAYKTEQDMLPQGLNQADYEKIYMRVYGPRYQTYMFFGVMAILIGSPIAMYILQQGLNMAYHMSGQNRAIEPGYLVWQTLLFFSLIFIWVGIGYVVARIYHSKTPGNLQYEIDQHLYADSNYGEEF